jgi:hypothetical protein
VDARGDDDDAVARLTELTFQRRGAAPEGLTAISHFGARIVGATDHSAPHPSLESVFRSL